MDTQYCITEARKGQHLLLREHYIIETRIRDGVNVYRFAKELNRSYNTIKAEIQRGTVLFRQGNVAGC